MRARSWAGADTTSGYPRHAPNSRAMRDLQVVEMGPVARMQRKTGVLRRDSIYPDALNPAHA